MGNHICYPCVCGKHDECCEVDCACEICLADDLDDDGLDDDGLDDDMWGDIY